MGIDACSSTEEESAAVVRFVVAFEELLAVGLAMSARLRPEEHSEALDAIQRGVIRPQLVVRMGEPARIELQGVGPGGELGARIFSFDVSFSSPTIN